MGFKEIQMKPPEQNQSWQFRKICEPPCAQEESLKTKAQYAC